MQMLVAKGVMKLLPPRATMDVPLAVAIVDLEF